MPIKVLIARQIFDSTGTPTVEVDIVTEIGLFRVGVPNTDRPKVGEAVQLRDENPKFFEGKGVLNAVKNINMIIAPEIMKSGIEVTNQKEVDNFLSELDGTENRIRLGSNAMLAVSLVCAKAGAAKKGIPLYRHVSDLGGVTTIVIPCPHIVILAGGVISNNALPFQEYSVIPFGANSFADAMRMGITIYKYVQNFARRKYGINATYCSESGAISLPINSHRDALVFLNEAIKSCKFSGKVDIGLTAVATDFFKDGAYDLEFKNPKSNPKDYVLAEDLMTMYIENYKEFNVTSIEDGFSCEDWESWSKATARVPPGMQLLANDLTQTNLKRIATAVEKKCCTGYTLRLNQLSTLSELIEAFKITRDSGFVSCINDRWGDTDDLILTDIVIGLANGQVKCGAPVHGERIGKYNQLIRIEEELGALSKYAGKRYRPVN